MHVYVAKCLTQEMAIFRLVESVDNARVHISNLKHHYTAKQYMYDFNYCEFISQLLCPKYANLAMLMVTKLFVRILLTK